MMVGLVLIALYGLLAALLWSTRDSHVMWPDYVNRLKALPEPIRTHNGRAAVAAANPAMKETD